MFTPRVIPRDLALVAYSALRSEAALFFPSQFFRRGISRAEESRTMCRCVGILIRSRRSHPFVSRWRRYYDSLALFREHYLSRRDSINQRKLRYRGSRKESATFSTVRYRAFRALLNIFRETFEDSVERLSYARVSFVAARALCADENCCSFSRTEVTAELPSFVEHNKFHLQKYLVPPSPRIISPRARSY